MSMISATVKVDNAELREELLTSFYGEEFDDRNDISIEKDVAELKLFFDAKPPINTIRAISKCEISYFRGYWMLDEEMPSQEEQPTEKVSAGEPIQEEVTAETVTAEAKLAAKTSLEETKVEEIIPTETKSKEEIIEERKRKVFDLKVRTCIEKNETIQEMAEDLGDIFKIYPKQLDFFKEVVVEAFELPIISKEEIKSALNKKGYTPEKNDISIIGHRIRGVLKKNGHKTKLSFYDFLDKIFEYRKSITTKTDSPKDTSSGKSSDEQISDEAGLIESSDEQISDEAGLIESSNEKTSDEDTISIDSIIKNVDKNLSFEDKVTQILSKIKELTDPKMLPKLEFELLPESDYKYIIQILKSNEPISNLVDKLMDPIVRMSLSSLLNGFTKQYGGMKYQVSDFLKALKDKI